jgi:hypothetical protein
LFLNESHLNGINKVLEFIAVPLVVIELGDGLVLLGFA